MSRGTLRTIALWFLAAEALLGAAWWFWVWADDDVRQRFFPAPIPDASLLAFTVADASLYAGGAAVAFVCLWRRATSTRLVLIVHATATWYAGVFAIAQGLLDPTTILGAWAMLPSMAILPFLIGFRVESGANEDAVRYVERLAPETGSTTGHLLRTLLQVVAFWGTFLWLFPALIHATEIQFDLPMRFAPQRVAGWTLFGLASCLGIWSAWTMCRIGAGTPLPLDAPNRLVARGPYAYLRNPMALAGIAQGVGVTLARGSGVGVVYAISGAFAWHFLARPNEERALAERFGTDFAAYRKAVRCWLPRLTPWQ